MVTIVSELKYGTYSLTSKSADLVITGTDCLQLALSQKRWDLAAAETAGARVLAHEVVCWSLLTEQKRSKAGLSVCILRSTPSVPNCLPEISKLFPFQKQILNCFNREVRRKCTGLKNFLSAFIFGVNLGICTRSSDWAPPWCSRGLDGFETGNTPWILPLYSSSSQNSFPSWVPHGLNSLVVWAESDLKINPSHYSRLWRTWGIILSIETTHNPIIIEATGMDDIAQDENRRGLRVESIPRTKQKTGEMKRTEKGAVLAIGGNPGKSFAWRQRRSVWCWNSTKRYREKEDKIYYSILQGDFGKSISVPPTCLWNVAPPMSEHKHNSQGKDKSTDFKNAHSWMVVANQFHQHYLITHMQPE